MKQPVRVCLDIDPTGERRLFRTAAADDVLRLLIEATEAEFTVRELTEATDASRSTVWRAVDLLEETGVIEVRRTPQRNYVRIDPTRIETDDPVLVIDQPVFHPPVRAFVTEARDALPAAPEVSRLVGVVVFGSVARGEADRRSDIDLFVVVDGDRTAARRVVRDVVGDLEDRRFQTPGGTEGGERFEFEPYVESVESVRRVEPDIREILDEGITVYDDGLGPVRKEVVTDE